MGAIHSRTLPFPLRPKAAVGVVISHAWIGCGRIDAGEARACVRACPAGSDDRRKARDCAVVPADDTVGCTSHCGRRHELRSGAAAREPAHARMVPLYPSRTLFVMGSPTLS